MKHTPDIKNVTWDEVRNQVKKIAPDIFTAIERLNPDKNYKLYKTRYPYGAMIIGENGTFNIPQNEQLISINDTQLSSKLYEDLSYNYLGVPMGLILGGGIQLYTEEHGDVETECLYESGVMMALRAVLDPILSYQSRRYWRMTSGLRTPVMLPSISDQILFTRLKRKFHLNISKPETQYDQWRLFVELANHENFSEPWFTEILFFSAKWLQPREDEGWKLFRLALLERAWKASAYPRNTSPINRIWTKFITNIRNKKATSFVLNMVRHIIEASLGEAISYAPCDAGSKGGPFDALIKIIMEDYGLKKSAPIIMLPTYFTLDNLCTTYISLQTPGSHWVKPRINKNSNLIGDTREIKYVLGQFITQIEQGHIKVEDMPLSKLTNIEYKFYHADKDKYGELLSSAHVLDGDPIMEKWRKHPTNNELSYRNSFLRSCVKITAKNKQ
jgi:hypothetical protein